MTTECPFFSTAAIPGKRDRRGRKGPGCGWKRVLQSPLSFQSTHRSFVCLKVFQLKHHRWLGLVWGRGFVSPWDPSWYTFPSSTPDWSSLPLLLSPESPRESTLAFLAISLVLWPRNALHDGSGSLHSPWHTSHTQHCPSLPPPATAPHSVRTDIVFELGSEIQTYEVSRFFMIPNKFWYFIHTIVLNDEVHSEQSGWPPC